jgi:hypothetical protein
VHVHRERGGGCGPGEPDLEPRGLLQAQPPAAQLGRDERCQVTRLCQLGEVLREEAVLGVVLGGAAAESFETLRGQDVLLGYAP